MPKRRRMNGDPYVGYWSLRSGTVYRDADGSVTVWDTRLQSWIMRPTRYRGYERRNRDHAQADQAPSSPLDDSN